MEELVGADGLERHEQRCADCGIALEKAEDYGAVCEQCGEPMCRDCELRHTKREEAMVCLDCWESNYLTGEE